MQLCESYLPLQCNFKLFRKCTIKKTIICYRCLLVIPDKNVPTSSTLTFCWTGLGHHCWKKETSFNAPRNQSLTIFYFYWNNIWVQFKINSLPKRDLLIIFFINYNFEKKKKFMLLVFLFCKGFVIVFHLRWFFIQ